MKNLFSLILIVIFAISLCACNSGKNTDNNTSEKEGKATPSDVVKISTPYSDLQLKKSTAENVSYDVTSNDPYTLTFKAKKDDTNLFSLVFDGTGGDLLGTIIDEDKNTVLYVNMFDLNSNSENYQEYTSYQMSINDIVDSLLNNKNFVYGEVVEYEDKSNFDIKTSFVTLKYPNKWKDKVDIGISDDAVMFSFKGVNIFDIYFKEIEGGSQIGTYNETPIFVVSYLPDQDKLSDAELNEYNEMQYDINIILNNLKNDKNFKSLG